MDELFVFIIIVVIIVALVKSGNDKKDKNNDDNTILPHYKGKIPTKMDSASSELLDKTLSNISGNKKRKF